MIVDYVHAPLPHLRDDSIEECLSRLGAQTGGCLRERTLRAETVRALTAEQDRRVAEHLWAMPVARGVT